MLQLLSPLALLALAALALPAILHLWRPPPTTVRVGTLRFFTGPAVRRLTKLRWRERLLLAVRLLLLALLALLLAQPIWKKEPPTKPQRWALLEPGIVLQGDALKRWRELDAEGFETRALERGFRIVSPTDERASEAGGSDVWSLLRELDARLPRGSRVAVFASDRVVSLRGERPAMQHSQIEWVSSETAPRSSPWIETVTQIAEGAESKLRVVVASSNAAHTQRVTLLVPSSSGRTQLAAPLERFAVEIADRDGGVLSARLISDDADAPTSEWVPAATPKPLHIAVLHATDRADDARYVRAALRAAAEAVNRDLLIDEDVARAEWIVWLNDEPVPTAVVDQVKTRGALLLSDAENSRDAAVSVITSVQAESLHEHTALFRRVPPTSPGGVAVWTDGFGTPLLSSTAQGAGRHYLFYSRFHPEWNDLTRSSALAAAFRPLIAADQRDHRASAEDLRRVGADQARPADAPASGERGELRLTPRAEIVDLHPMLWLLCIALFAIERTLSHLNRTRPPESPASVPKREPEFAELA